MKLYDHTGGSMKTHEFCYWNVYMFKKFVLSTQYPKRVEKTERKIPSKTSLHYCLSVSVESTCTIVHRPGKT
jgi:hypothetical protein